MEILLTGPGGPLGDALMKALAGRHRLRTVGGSVPGDRHIAGDLRNPDVARTAAAGVDCIIHLAPISPKLKTIPAGEALDWISRGTYNLYQAAIDAGVNRVVQASTLEMYAAYPPQLRPDPAWLPLPDTSINQLSASLMERSAREFATVARLPVMVLRTGVCVTEDEPRREAAAAIHVKDAVQGFAVAVEAEPGDGPWTVVHLLGRDDPYFRAAGTEIASALPGYEPQHPAPAIRRPADRTSGRGTTSRGWRRQERDGWPGLAKHLAQEGRNRGRVVMYGAGGPVLAAAARAIGNGAVVRFTDAVALWESAANPQSRYAPVPEPVEEPHEERVVDVTEPQQVRQACEGMDVVINGAVVRHELVPAFRVNVMGCYHVLAAAVDAGIRRVVHTGPQLVTAYFSPFGYDHDADVPSDAPPRPGLNLYGHTKVLSYELCRIFAEEHDVTIPNLTFNKLLDPQREDPGRDTTAMAISWMDAGRAIWAAAQVPDQQLPAPYAPFHIMADLPHGRFHNEAARQHLGWEPQDDLQAFWWRDR